MQQRVAPESLKLSLWNIEFRGNSVFFWGKILAEVEESEVKPLKEIIRQAALFQDTAWVWTPHIAAQKAKDLSDSIQKLKVSLVSKGAKEIFTLVSNETFAWVSFPVITATKDSIADIQKTPSEFTKESQKSATGDDKATIKEHLEWKTKEELIANLQQIIDFIVVPKNNTQAGSVLTWRAHLLAHKLEKEASSSQEKFTLALQVETFRTYFRLQWKTSHLPHLQDDDTRKARLPAQEVTSAAIEENLVKHGTLDANVLVDLVSRFLLGITFNPEITIREIQANPELRKMYETLTRVALQYRNQKENKLRDKRIVEKVEEFLETLDRYQYIFDSKTINLTPRGIARQGFLQKLNDETPERNIRDALSRLEADIGTRHFEGSLFVVNTLIQKAAEVSMSFEGQQERVDIAKAQHYASDFVVLVVQSMIETAKKQRRDEQAFVQNLSSIATYIETLPESEKKSQAQKLLADFRKPYDDVQAQKQATKAEKEASEKQDKQEILTKVGKTVDLLREKQDFRSAYITEVYITIYTAIQKYFSDEDFVAQLSYFERRLWMEYQHVAYGMEATTNSYPHRYVARQSLQIQLKNWLSPEILLEEIQLHMIPQLSPYESVKGSNLYYRILDALAELQKIYMADKQTIAQLEALEKQVDEMLNFKSQFTSKQEWENHQKVQSLKKVLPQELWVNFYDDQGAYFRMVEDFISQAFVDKAGMQSEAYLRALALIELWEGETGYVAHSASARKRLEARKQNFIAQMQGRETYRKNPIQATPSTELQTPTRSILGTIGEKVVSIFWRVTRQSIALEQTRYTHWTFSSMQDVQDLDTHIRSDIDWYKQNIQRVKDIIGDIQAAVKKETVFSWGAFANMIGIFYEYFPENEELLKQMNWAWAELVEALKKEFFSIVYEYNTSYNSLVDGPETDAYIALQKQKMEERLSFATSLPGNLLEREIQLYGWLLRAKTFADYNAICKQLDLPIVQIEPVEPMKIAA